MRVAHDVLDDLEILVCGLDDQGTIHLFNRPCEKLTGIPRDDAIGRSWLDTFEIRDRSDQVTALWREAYEDGPSGPCEALSRNGRTVRWQFSRFERSEAEPISLWAVGLDITEEQRARQRVRELDRLRSLGNLLSGLTHELRNPLNGALLQLAVAERQLAKLAHVPEPALGAIAQARCECRRIAALLDDFLVVARPQPLRLERCDLREVSERAIERAAAKARAALVTVTMRPGPEALAEVDAPRVESAIYNLVANAVDAATESAGRDVEVRVLIRGNVIAIEVEDHGPGIADAELPIFEPFFTTKQGGTGLGLAIVQRVVAELGGRVGYDRRRDATVFLLELPIVSGTVN